MKRIAGIKFCLIFCLLMGFRINAQVNLWVMSFDNLFGDSEIGWLREGFADFIIDHYSRINEVSAFKADKLENVIGKIKSDARFKDVSNYVLAGAYQRQNGEYIIELQITDLADWKTISSKTVREKSTDLGQLVETVNTALDEILLSKSVQSVPNLPVPQIEAPKIDLTKDARLDEFHEMKTATRNIGEALDQLLGTFQPEPAQKSETVMPFGKEAPGNDPFTFKVKEYIQESHSFESILNRLLYDPYLIEIGEPAIQRLPLEKDKIVLSFTVDYQLRIPILRDMIESMKIKTRSETDGYLEYSFSGNEYVFSADFIRRVACGDYRFFPVILMLDGDGKTIYKLIDFPYYRQDLYNVQKFEPMFNISAGPWTINIHCSKNIQSVKYEMKIPLTIVAQISQVAIKMLNEEEIIELSKE
jgi:TolB-like protein